MIRPQLSRIVVVVGLAPVVVATSGCQFPVDRAANRAFRGGRGQISVTVFPAFVRRGSEASWDQAAAHRIGAFFADQHLAEVTVSDAEVPITGSWHSDQPTMLKEGAEAFAAYIKQHPVETEFALLPEYMLVPSRPRRIHCYVVDAESRLAYVVLLNSKWPIFAEVNPRSVEDSTEVLIRFLEEDLQPVSTGE